jgi:hypothetical protein
MLELSVFKVQGAIPERVQATRAPRSGSATKGQVRGADEELVCKGAAWTVANPTLGLPTRRPRVARELPATDPAVPAMA